jgi:hypothetical protein
MKHKKHKKTKIAPVSNIITGYTFQGVVWDQSSLEVVKIVAQGLTNLTELFKSQNVNIESLLKIDK